MNDYTPDQVMLNPKHLKCETSQDVPEYVVEYLEKQDSDQLNTVNNEVIRMALEWIQNPMNSRNYRNYVLFKSIPNRILSEDDDYVKPGLELEIPIIGVEF